MLYDVVTVSTVHVEVGREFSMFIIFNNHYWSEYTFRYALVKTKYLRIGVVFVIGPQDTTQNFVFDEGKIYPYRYFTCSRGS